MTDSKKLTENPRFTGLLWLVLRLFVAYQWVMPAWKKVTDPAWTGAQVPQALHKFLTGALDKTGGDNPQVFGWYADFIRNVALPNEKVMSYVIAYGELLVGIALALGLFTRWAAAWGAFMNLNYIFAGSANANGYMLAAQTAMVFGGLGLSYYGLSNFVLPYLRKLVPALPPPHRAVTVTDTRLQRQSGERMVR